MVEPFLDLDLRSRCGNPPAAPAPAPLCLPPACGGDDGSAAGSPTASAAAASAVDWLYTGFHPLGMAAVGACGPSLGIGR